MSDGYKSIKSWPEHDRPRERLLKYGPDTLSEAELLAIILRTGNGKATAMDLARQLLKTFDGLRGLDTQPAEALCKVNGIGIAKAAQLKSAFELSKRLVQQQWGSNSQRIHSSEDVYQCVHLRMRDLNREEFRVLFLTSRNELIAEKILFEGSLSESVVSPREVILKSVQLSAARIILLHNHPSGHPDPSDADKRVTHKLVTACKYAEIEVLDHIIIGRDSFFSFADHGLLR